MRCEKCGFENPDNMKFCGHCAAPLNRICPSCGFSNPPGFGYCGQCATALSSAPDAPAQVTTFLGHEAERRQLTVMFCDMVGSSSLSERIDPEDLRDIMRDYRSVCSEAIHRHGGYIAQYLGDGVLVYFGYPQANEDDARRAVHAALELCQEIPKLSFPTQSGDDIQLAIRIGIHTGLVVIGEIGGGDKRTTALGETPNIAARIQDRAQANSVIVSEVTHRLLGEQFACESLGQHHLKGFSQSLGLFRVKHTQDTPFKNYTFTHHSQLIGREQESELLLERLEQARKGVGQVVLLNGEPGLGKTRMVQVLCEKVSATPSFILECSGSTYYKNSFLHPIIALLNRTLELSEISNPREKLHKLEQSIATLGLDANHSVPILAELLAIPLSANYAIDAESTPQQKKQQTLDTLVAVLQTIAQQRFVLLIVEDLQWVDPSTLELLTQLTRLPVLSNLFAIFTFRNEFIPPWPPRVNLTQITLNRLTRHQSGKLIKQLCQGKTLPLEVFSELINKTDGIPLFVEELTNTILQSGILQEESDHYKLNAPIAQLGIPATLQDSLMSRLDNLGEDKELAQLSAALGREFDHELLSVVSTRDEISLRNGLDHLINAELFYQRGQPPKAWYSFRHALLREAAYQSLLKRTRQQIHQRIAELLKLHFPHTIENNPELIAHHCTEAGMLEEALQYWLLAGQHAIQRSANLEAMAHLKNGLDLLHSLPNIAEHRSTELTYQTTLGLAAMMSKGYAATEAEQAYSKAQALCTNINDPKIVFPVLCGLWEYYIVRADLETAGSLAANLRTLATDARDTNLAVEADRIMGTTQFWQGQLLDANKHLDIHRDFITSCHSVDQTTLQAYCQDARVATHANAACILWLTGHPDQALERANQALDIAKRLAHPFSQAYALHFLTTIMQLRGDKAATAKHAEALIALSQTYGFFFWVATGNMLLCWANPKSYSADKVLADFQQALETYEKSGNRLARTYFLALLAELFHSANRTNDALTTIENAILEATQTGEGFFIAELLRLRGVLLLSSTPNSSDTVETLLTKAIEQAQQQGAKSLALRAANSLAKLWHIQSKNHEINQLLTTHLADIQEGMETADILEARQFLNIT